MEALYSYRAISPSTIYMSTFCILLVVMLVSVACGAYSRSRYHYRWAIPLFVVVGLIVSSLAIAKTGNLSQFCSFQIKEGTLELSYALPPQTVSVSFKDVQAIRIVDHRLMVLTSSEEFHRSGVIFIRDQPDVAAALRKYVPSFTE